MTQEEKLRFGIHGTALPTRRQPCAADLDFAMCGLDGEETGHPTTRPEGLCKMVKGSSCPCALLFRVVSINAAISSKGGTVVTRSSHSNFQLVTTLMGRLGSVHGLRQVPMTLEDAVTMTEALVLDKVLATLRQDAIIGAYHIDDP